MKFKLPDAFKKPALAAIENAIEKQVEENYDKTADAVIASLKKAAGSNKLILSFLEHNAGIAKAGAKIAILGAVDKIDGVPKEQEGA